MTTKQNTQKVSPATKVTTTTVDRSLVESALSALASVESRHRDEIRAARIAAAPFVFAAFSDGTIGKSIEKGGILGTPQEVADTYGMSRANVTGLRTLGHCLSLGIDPNGRDRDAWKVLSDQANASWITSVLADKPTATKVRKAVGEYVKGKAATPVNGPAKGRKPGTPDSPASDATKADKAPATNAGRLTQVETLLSALTMPLSDADRATLQGIAARVALILAPAENVKPVRKVARKSA